MFQHLPLLMFKSPGLVLLVALLAVAEGFGQAAKPAPLTAQHAIKLAQNGHCEEAVASSEKGPPNRRLIKP